MVKNCRSPRCPKGYKKSRNNYKKYKRFVTRQPVLNYKALVDAEADYNISLIKQSF